MVSWRQRVLPNKHGAGGGALYEPLDAGSAPADPRARGFRSRCLRCLNTQGVAFNLLVGLVVCANTVLIGLEVDLGLLGNDSPQWLGLVADMDLIGVDRSNKKSIKSELQKGIEVDAGLKLELREGIDKQFNKDMDIQGELNLRKGSAHLKSGAYTVCEFFFVAFFALELLLRMCDSHGRGFCHDTWNLFDALLVTVGLADLTLPFFLTGPEVSATGLTCLSILRTMRVFRVIRLFRVSNELKTTAWGFMKAFATVLWTLFIVLIVNFVVASLVTTWVGQKAHLWGAQAEQIDHWFGSFGRSLQTLFGIMTLSGWDHIAVVLASVIPGTIVASWFVLYIMMCFFAMLSLASGLVNTSFMTAQKADDQRRAHVIEDNRAMFTGALASILTTCDHSKTGFLTRLEYQRALESHPTILAQLKKLDIETNTHELLQIFDRLSQDSACAGTVKIDALVEAAVLLGCTAGSSEVFDVKYLLASMRREVAGQLAALRCELTGQQHEVVGKVADVRKEVSTVLQGISAVQHQTADVSREVDAVKGRLDHLDKQGELDKAQELTFRIAAHQKLDALAAQLASISTVNEKLDALATHISSQATFNEKLDALSTQFAAQFAAQFTAQFALVGASSGLGARPSPSPSPTAAWAAASPSGKPEEPESTACLVEGRVRRAALFRATEDFEKPPQGPMAAEAEDLLFALGCAQSAELPGGGAGGPPEACAVPALPGGAGGLPEACAAPAPPAEPETEFPNFPCDFGATPAAAAAAGPPSTEQPEPAAAGGEASHNAP